MVQKGINNDISVNEIRVLLGPLGHDTWQVYRTAIQQFAQWLNGRGKIVLEADERDLRAYISYLQGNIDTLTSGPCGHYAPSTIYHKVCILRRLYASLHKHDLIPCNPVARLRIPYGETKKHPRNTRLSVEKVRQLLATPDPNRPVGIRDRAVLVLMVLHGLRIGEVQQLSLEDVDLANGTIRVSGRCSKPRMIYLTAATRQVIEVWLAVRRLLDSGSAALFITLHWTSGRANPGQRISTRGLRQAVNGYLQAIGVKSAGVNCQVLRRTYAGLSLEAGASLPEIVESMGGSVALRRTLSTLAEQVLTA